MFHCTAGKDRTGVLAAILLLLLGVAEEDIIADDQVSFTYNRRGVNQLLARFCPPASGCMQNTHGMVRAVF